MKFAVVLLALVAFAASAPQPRKIFHENFEDFLDLIEEESGDELRHLMEHYEEFEEFMASVDYMKTNNFKELVYEMESLPEFKAVQDFLDSHSIDLSYFIDLFNALLESGENPNPLARHALSGQDFSSFVKDSIAVFPKDKLAALFEQKLAEDEDFKAAIEGLESEEFSVLFDALWNNAVFQAEVQALAANGIDVAVLFDQLVAIFGQDV